MADRRYFGVHIVDDIVNGPRIQMRDYPTEDRPATFCIACNWKPPHAACPVILYYHPSGYWYQYLLPLLGEGLYTEDEANAAFEAAITGLQQRAIAA